MSPGMMEKFRVSSGPLSSREWLEHFRANKEPEVLPEGVPGLTAAEREAAIPSIQEFQLGENSEGKNLHRRAKEYAGENADPEYLLAVEYFIREEQRHARYLRDFLATEGFGTIKHRWADSVFRKLRNLAGLEVSVAVLVTAEIIAEVYYAALQGATRSPMLRAICRRVLRDEEAHVRFQAERLAILRRDRTKPAMTLTRLLHRTLYLGAILVVWRNHGPAIRRGGFDFRDYWRRCWKQFGIASKIMEPSNYEQLPG
ncbi:MAG: ferritin-like domain-containing protein [Rubrobacteraceae bacterium]